MPRSRSKEVEIALALWLSMTKEAVTAIHKGGANSSAKEGDRVNTAHTVRATDTYIQ